MTSMLLEDEKMLQMAYFTLCIGSSQFSEIALERLSI